MPNTDPLVGALRECSLHSLLMLTSKVLTRAGFGDVEILDRRETGQKSRHSGHEISCLTYVGSLPLRAIVKVVPQYDLKTRHFDELAGGVLRAGADLGLLVTPHKVSASIAGKQPSYRPARIEVMDGEALASLMRCSGIAVRPSGDVDYSFLSELEEVSARLLGFIRKERP